MAKTTEELTTGTPDDDDTVVGTQDGTLTRKFTTAAIVAAVLGAAGVALVTRGAADVTWEYVDGTETIDLSASEKFRQTDVLGGNTVITGTNAANGMDGRIIVKEGASTYTLQLLITGAALRDLNDGDTSDVDIVTTANALSYLSYDCYTAPTTGLTCDYWVSPSAAVVPLVGTTVTANLFSATPTTFTTTSGAASLDVGAYNDHRQTDSIDEATVLTLTNCTSGRQGTVDVIQNGTGYAVTFAASGRTVKYSQAVPTTASAEIAIGYYCRSTDRLDIFPAEMQ